MTGTFMWDGFYGTDHDDDEPAVPPADAPPGAAVPDAPAAPGDAALGVVSSPGEPMANARTFVAEVYTSPDGHPRLLSVGDTFYRYDGTAWRDVPPHEMSAALYRAFEHARYVNEEGQEKRFQPTRAKVANVEDALRAVCLRPVPASVPAWLADAPNDPPAGEIIPCTNGLLHWPTRRLLEHTPRLFAHHSVDLTYDPAAPIPTRWLGFLAELFPDDPEAVQAVQEMLGYLLSGDLTLHKMFLIVGPRRSGKGTIARVATELLGRHHVAGPTLASLTGNFGLQPLIGKSTAIVSDARLSSKVNQDALAERLLAISGEDRMTVDRKYREPWHGTLPTRFVVLSNELPRLADASGALSSRFVVVTMTRSFYGREDPHLTAALLAELPGILNWALDGLDRLRTRGRFSTPKSSADAVRELEDLGSPVGAFLRDRCAVEPGASVAVAALYEKWTAWCRTQGRDHAGTVATLGRDVRAAVPGLIVSQPRVGGKQVRHYEGLRLKTSAELLSVDDDRDDPVTRDDAGVAASWSDSDTTEDEALADEWGGGVVTPDDQAGLLYGVWDDLAAGPCARCHVVRVPNRYGESADTTCPACRAALVAEAHK